MTSDATHGHPETVRTAEDSVARRPRRVAPLVAVPIAIILALLVVLLATGSSSSDRFEKSPLVGTAAPPIVGTTIAGESFSLDRLRGQWVVVNFFGSWCTPCIQEHPELVKFAERHRQRGDASVVTVAFADSPTNVRQFFEQRGGDWPVLARDTNSIAVGYGVIKVPETYLITPTGSVAGKLVGGITADQLDSVIVKLSTPSDTR